MSDPGEGCQASGGRIGPTRSSTTRGASEGLEQMIGPHDLYFLYLFPTHFISGSICLVRRRAARTLYDLRPENNGAAR